MEWGTPREEGCLGTELAGVCSVCQQLATTLGCSSREHPSQQRATLRRAPLQLVNRESSSQPSSTLVLPFKPRIESRV
jgi:hypothetical protein